MTLTTTATKDQYDGDDATTVFPITFVFYENAGIKVILTVDATGVETVQTLATDYTLSGGAGENGNCTMIVTPATGETLTIKSDIDDTQETSLPLGGEFPSTSVEQRFDIITRLIQQQAEELARAVVLAESSETVTVFLPEPVSGKFLGWDAGLQLENKDITLVAGTAAGVDQTDTNTDKDKLISNFLAKTYTDYVAVGHLPLAGGSLTGLVSTNKAINENQGANIASAATTDIGAATGNFVFVTGTTTITALGTIQAGVRRVVKFTGALLLTYDGVALLLPGQANITTSANDVAIFQSLGSGNWICISYHRATGKALVAFNTKASQAEMEAATDDARFLTPLIVNHHPGMAKGWINFDLNGTSAAIVAASYNFTSITSDTVNGFATINWATDFSSADYCIVGTGQRAASFNDCNIAISRDTNPTAGATAIFGNESSGGGLDCSIVCVAVFGDQ